MVDQPAVNQLQEVTNGLADGDEKKDKETQTLNLDYNELLCEVNLLRECNNTA